MGKRQGDGALTGRDPTAEIKRRNRSEPFLDVRSDPEDGRAVGQLDQTYYSDAKQQTSGSKLQT